MIILVPCRRNHEKTGKIMQKPLIIGVIAMATVVVASNILVQFLLLDGLLTWGAFTYPVAFLVTDVMNRAFGAAQARRVIFAGFVTGVICSIIGSQIMLEFGPAVPLRIAIASGSAFLIAQLVDVAVFNRLRMGSWWRAPLVSSLIGSALDTALFFTIAFSAQVTVFGADADAAISWAWEGVPFMMFGAIMPLWVTLAVADWLVKLTIALIALIPFKWIVTKVSPQPL